jgi:hypothetical protein
VLFLNKCDELEHKLALGLRVDEFLPQLSSKRETGNDVESIKNRECTDIRSRRPDCMRDDRSFGFFGPAVGLPQSRMQDDRRVRPSRVPEWIFGISSDGCLYCASV